jgi:hypothetical protein
MTPGADKWSTFAGSGFVLLIAARHGVEHQVPMKMGLLMVGSSLSD